MWGRISVVLMCAGCAVSTPVAIPGFSTNPYKERQRLERRAAADLSPRELEVPDGAPPVRAYQLRVWVDADYRQRPRWRSEVEASLGRVSAYTQAAFGAKLEVDVRAWDRSGDLPMAEMIAALEEHDPGDGADWVVGLVTAPRGLTADYHRLGLAEIPGKYFVLRDMNDAEEARTVDQVFDELSAAERSEIYASRKRHKELLCFLHEWAHTLGHGHEAQAELVMAPAYSNRATGFSDAGVRLLRAALAARGGGQAVAKAAAPATAAPATASPAAQPVRAVPAAAAAETVAAPIMPLPSAASVARTVTARDRAAAAAPAPADAVRDAYDRYRADDGRGAMVLLDGARPRLAPGSDDWENAVRIYLAIGALSRADELLALAPDDPRVPGHRTEIARMRRETALPADAAKSGVLPEDEPEVRAAVVAATNAIVEHNLTSARRQLARLQKAHPKALAAEVLACGIAGADGKAAEARKRCGAALARWDESPYAHFWLGQLAPSAKERIAHHRRVIEIDPEQESSWQALGELFRQTGDQKALIDLRAAFRARFGRSPPWGN
jgi:hypothetical protein